MSNKNDSSNPDAKDAALFRAAIGEVRRIPETALPPAAPRPTPRARMAEQDEISAREEFRHVLDKPLLEAGDILSYRSEQLPLRAFQRLKHGEIAVQDELDLHGSDTAQAEDLLRKFIAETRKQSSGCVRIIHGKGLHDSGSIASSRSPVLKNLVDGFLRRRADILGFHSAPTAQGGTGAVHVLLKPMTRAR